MNLIARNIKLYLTGFLLLFYSIKIVSANLNLIVIDPDNGKLIPARILIYDEKGNSFCPEGAIKLKIGTEKWFMSPGKSFIEVPKGELTLRVERGKEYERLKQKIEIQNEDTSQIRVKLKRWINMKELGYLSSENHIHLNAENAGAMCASEDLDYGTSLQWWNRPRFGVTNGKENIRRVSFGRISIPVTIFDVEVEEAWGALYIINLPNPFPFLNDKGMPNLIAAEYGKERSALVCYQSGWSREVLIDALLGYVDVVNVCNNNFHMHRYQPRSLYSNLLNIKGFPIYPNTPEGMYKMNTDTYYRLLNCGLELAAGAGSATGAKETPVGFNRTYVRCSKEDTLDGFIKAWQEGKNFVTNGPMLFFQTVGGLQPGDSLKILDNKEITFLVEVISDSHIKTIELVANGEIVKSFQVPHNAKRFKGNFEIKVSESTWICARCTDNDELLTDRELGKYRSPRTHLFQDPNRLRYAHTSPIYFYVNGKEIAIRKSVHEGLRIIDAFKEFARLNTSQKFLPIILTSVNKAREILKQKIN